MKLIPLSKCEIDIIECDCGYHMGVDATFLDQVGDFKTKCPSCSLIIDTSKVYDYDDALYSMLKSDQKLKRKL